MPEACPSMRSTARWVLPVLVGPENGDEPRGVAPRRRAIHATNVEDVGVPRKPLPSFKRADLVTPGFTFP